MGCPIWALTRCNAGLRQASLTAQLQSAPGKDSETLSKLVEIFLLVLLKLILFSYSSALRGVRSAVANPEQRSQLPTHFAFSLLVGVHYFPHLGVEQICDRQTLDRIGGHACRIDCWPKIGILKRVLKFIFGGANSFGFGTAEGEEFQF